MSPRALALSLGLAALPGLTSAMAAVPPAAPHPAILSDATQPQSPRPSAPTGIYGPMTGGSAISPPARCMTSS
ncbi:hypothetical protein [Komagataeibacter intermedius]|uniref:hypothetical protein n=1 Tax=Komagataeibacter intermedius TaxID=66229 RepID=UPI003B43D619